MHVYNHPCSQPCVSVFNSVCAVLCFVFAHPSICVCGACFACVCTSITCSCHVHVYNYPCSQPSISVFNFVCAVLCFACVCTSINCSCHITCEQPSMLPTQHQRVQFCVFAVSFFCFCLHIHQLFLPYHICRVGQNRIYTSYMTVFLVIFLPKIPYTHRTYMVLANPTHVNNHPCSQPSISVFNFVCGAFFFAWPLVIYF